MPKGPRKYDPKEAEHEYVTTDISLRALASKLDVSFSSLAAFARKEDWTGKRVAYQAALSRRTYDVMAQEAGDMRGVIRSESIKLLRAQLAVGAEQLAARKMAMTPKDMIETVRALAVLLGEEGGAASDDRTIIQVNSSRSVDTDLLRRIADAARGQVSADRVLAGTVEREPERTRPN
jgi:hypothetical protein